MKRDVIHLPAELDGPVVRAAICATASIMKSGANDCCYQLSESLAGALRDNGIEAEAVLCDVFGWNEDGQRLLEDIPFWKKWTMWCAARDGKAAPRTFQSSLPTQKIVKRN